MALLGSVYRPAFQQFVSEDYQPLASLPIHVCPQTSERYVLWSNVQDAFEGVVFLRYWSTTRVLFMTRQDGELYRPLRIQHKPQAYRVFSHRVQGRHAVKSQYTQNTNDNPSTIDALDKEQHTHLARRLEHLYETYMVLFERIKASIKCDRDEVLPLVANARYFHVELLEELGRLDRDGVKALVHGLNHDQIRNKLGVCEHHVSDWEFWNACWNSLSRVVSRWDYATSRLFVVLPSDLDSWVDTDPSTHQFRLHFICENCKSDGNSGGLPQYVHLSNHPGYKFRRQQEFFQEYGDYVLRVLEMVEYGHSNVVYEIPSLDTFKILWQCDSGITGSRLCKDSIGPLIDKAIGYLQGLSPPEWKSRPWLTRSQSAAIKSYLDVQEGDNAEGNLHRCINNGQHVYWKCRAHYHRYTKYDPVERLTKYVCSHGGQVNMQQATFSIDLGSAEMADTFRNLLLSTSHKFNISITLSWAPTRSYVESFFSKIAKTGIVILEIDGITVDIHPQDHVHYMTDLIANGVTQKSNIKLVRLLNYPRPNEQCLYSNKFAIQTTCPPTQSTSDWVEFWSDLIAFGDIVSKTRFSLHCEAAARELQLALARNGFPVIFNIAVYDEDWHGVFSLMEGAFVEVHSFNMLLPEAVAPSKSLRVLTQYLLTDEFDQQFYDTIQTNIGLQEITIATYARNILLQIELVSKARCISANPLRLTLIDRMDDDHGRDHGRVVAQVDIAEHIQETPDSFHILQWDCDHVASPISDYFASFLDFTIQQCPSALTSFTLDISILTPTGLSSVENSLRLSRLEHLSIFCRAITPTHSSSVAQVLASVPWSTLKSLVLFGNLDRLLWALPTRVYFFSIN
ncbi:hypothetical protein MVEG_01329 [Podila verticillata NRRL 6337]|nr:hypothetical protein MVEG_01329 [Podila verticillata NRRL 6337]